MSASRDAVRVRGWRRLVAAQEAGIFVALAVLCLIIVLATSGQFLRPDNLQNITKRSALLAIFAMGETFVIITGGIDLSVGSLVALTGVLATKLMVDAGQPLWVAVLVVLGVSAGVGLFHGAAVTKLRFQPFVVTLATMLILRGAALNICNQEPIPVPGHNDFDALANGLAGRLPIVAYTDRGLGPGWLQVPIPAYILLGEALIFGLALSATAFGRHLIAVGNNEEAARLSGVPVTRVKVAAYVICALMVGFSGVLEASLSGQGDYRAGQLYELMAIAASVIGGCSLMGGQGSVVGTILGAGVLIVIDNGINLAGKNPSFWRDIVVGATVFLAVLVDIGRQWWRRRR